MILNETFTLANGVEIPKLGLGTWMITGADAERAVKDAIELGYRHIDSAQDYGNETEVGAAIKASGIKREEIFVTTKLAAGYKTYQEAVDAINGSLNKLDLDYIDLMIIHSPQPWPHFGSEDRFEEGNCQAWQALEEAYKAGKIKAIGLSNFTQYDIDNILANCTVKPMLHQLLAHVTNVPTELIEYSQSKGMVVEAYSPVGHGEMFKNADVAAMAQKYSVSIPQLCIRYTLQLGLLPLPKTANKAHMENNADLEFVITDEDMKVLNELKKIEDYGDASVFPVYQQK